MVVFRSVVTTSILGFDPLVPPSLGETPDDVNVGILIGRP